MRKDFTQIIQRAKLDPITAIAIFDNGSFKQVLKPTYGKDLISNFGSIENYLEKLKKDNIQSITIQEYRKNGSSIKKIGNPVSVNFGNEKQVNTMQQNNSLSGFGLGFTEIMNLNTDSVLKTKFETELEYLKKELEETKKQRDELKEELLKMRYDSEKGSKNSETITSLVTAFAPMLQGFLVNNQKNSLNAPVQNNVSEIKNNLVSIVYNPNFSDDFAKLLINIVEQINSKESFYEKIIELIEN